MSQSQPVTRVLIANRGEIAVRIIRTLRQMDIASIALYSEADAGSLHVQMADFSVPLAGRSSLETYLDQEKILHAAAVAGADAVHPGYGFLSENADFAAAVRDAGLCFIGPSPESMRLLGHKINAKALMREHGIPLTPGSEGAISDAEQLAAVAEKIGYPLILKAAAGGGGRGMQVVRASHELEAAIASCQNAAQSYFNNPAVFAERYLERPRHIEVQVLCDQHGNGVHLGERDCSVQRRHQKLIEEAPSAFLDQKGRQRLGEIAVKAALAAGYSGVGTVEFICEDPETIYFMEVNTRIQVEHTVTELISGVDLVAEQIRVARGERLRFSNDDWVPQGHAIECRINAEDPLRDFMPTAGNVGAIQLPQGPWVRVDSHLQPGYTVPAEYDSMVAKLICWGADRQEAIARMLQALRELRIEGITTTASFHEGVLGDAQFREGDFDTSYAPEFIERWKAAQQQQLKGSGDADFLAAALCYQLQVQSHNRPPVQKESQWQMTARRDAVEGRC